MADYPMWRRLGARHACAALVLLMLTATSLAVDEDPRSAAAELHTKHGLVKTTGRVWGLPLETQLLARLKRLPDLRERILTTTREIEEAIVRNELAWQQAAPALEELRKQLAELSTGDPQRSLVSDQLERLQASVVHPAQLAGRGPVRTELIRLAQNRCTLILDLVWIRHTATELADRYQQLAAEGEVMRLIEQTGKQCRLGPLRNYAAEVRRLNDYEKLASAPNAPIYLQNGQARVTVAVNDATCVTFTWSDDSDAVTFLPASALEAAGIEIPGDAPREMLRIGNRRIEARQIVLPSLRLGSCHAKSVAAYVLPPEAEDLGAQLTPLAISPCRTRLELTKARLATEE
jgi:hypothetical protein